MPENNALEGLCTGLIEAWSLYGNPKAVILFVVESITYNICDQRFHEFYIRQVSSQTRVIRRTLTEIATKAALNSNQELIMYAK